MTERTALQVACPYRRVTVASNCFRSAGGSVLDTAQTSKPSHTADGVTGPAPTGRSVIRRVMASTTWPEVETVCPTRPICATKPLRSSVAKLRQVAVPAISYCDGVRRTTYIIPRPVSRRSAIKQQTVLP